MLGLIITTDCLLATNVAYTTSNSSGNLIPTLGGYNTLLVLMLARVGIKSLVDVPENV